MDRLDKLGGSDAMKRGVEGALRSSKQYVNPQITKAMTKLPAEGKYSHGGTKASIDRNMDVNWDGLIGSVKVGFDFKQSGMKSIFLMYGTPRMSPVEGLMEAIYGNRTQRQIAKLQREALEKVVERIMEG